MSQRFKAAENKNNSKNTRLDIAGEFASYRFGRDQLAHVSRYLFICEKLIELARKAGRPLTVIDIGCGNIYVARTLVSSFVVKKRDIISRYVGLDIDDKNLAIAEHSKPTSLDIELVCADITDGGLAQFKDKAFDMVVCTEVVEHIKPEFVLSFLKEIKRIGKFGLISTPNFTGGSGSLPQDHIKEWDTDELSDLMLEAGFKVNSKIGIFCNLQKVKQLAKEDKKINAIYSYLVDRMDSDFLSICMARFIGTAAQNVLYVCDL